MKQYYKRQPMGSKLLSDFNPHSFSNFDETKKNLTLQKMLRHINLYYSFYKQTPSFTYLVFVMQENLVIDEIEQGIKYLANYEWFSIVKARKTFTYHITEKFEKAFYYHCRG